jgi:hypothetical protein
MIIVIGADNTGVNENNYDDNVINTVFNLTHNMCNTQYVQYTICAIHNMCNTQYVQYTICAIHNMCNTQCVQYTIYAIVSISIVIIMVIT